MRSEASCAWTGGVLPGAAPVSAQSAGATAPPPPFAPPPHPAALRIPFPWQPICVVLTGASLAADAAWPLACSQPHVHATCQPHFSPHSWPGGEQERREKARHGFLSEHLSQPEGDKTEFSQDGAHLLVVPGDQGTESLNGKYTPYLLGKASPTASRVLSLGHGQGESLEQ